MASKKHYILTAVTLGAIAAASAALIGLTNLLTKKQIQKNELNSFNAGITALFGTPVFLGFPCGSAGKESSCNVGDLVQFSQWSCMDVRAGL